jgi:hypothetical protein
MTQDYTIVWPVRRTVSEDTIRMKYSDAVANGEVEYTDLTDIDMIMDELESAGQVKFSTPRRWPSSKLARILRMKGSTRNE